jgi:hypothetical protein
VPAIIRNWARDHGLQAVATSYSQLCFDKDDIHRGDVQAAFICPGHPLLDAVIGLTLERNRNALVSGAVLVDETDPGREPRMLFFLEQTIRDARPARDGQRRAISQEIHFVEVDAAGNARLGGGAPYIDYRPATDAERERLLALLSSQPFGQQQERTAMAYAINTLVPRHLEEVRQRRLDLIARTEAAVQDRLTREINFWDRRAAELAQQERAGRPNARLNSQKAQARADELSARLEKRIIELQQERQIVAEPPIITGGTLVVPLGLLLGERTPQDLIDTRITEQIAMHAVMETERRLGHDPRDVSMHKLGYDIESRDATTGLLRFIEVKGRRAGADAVTITRNEVLKALNVPEQFILALVEVEGAQAMPPRYVHRPFTREPDEGVASVNYGLRDLLARSVTVA